MVGYVIPLRAQASCRDWAKTVELLGNTLKSILNADDPDLQVFVCGHEVPPLGSIRDSRLHFETVDFPLPADSSQGNRDRNWKIAHGCGKVAESGIEWTFICDADDLLSRKLNGFISSNSNADAIVLHRGYVYNAAKRRIRSHRAIDRICGSTFAIRTQYIFANPSRNFHSNIFLRYNHSNLPDWLKEHQLRTVNVTQTPLVTYVVDNGSNLSMELGFFRHGFTNFVKFSVLGRRVSRSITREFTLT